MSQQRSVNKTGTTISVYAGELSDEGLVKSIARIKKSFPSLPLSFYDVLIDRLRESGFCDARLFDAVNYVIDHCRYPMPSIADFISYDVEVKLFTYPQIVEMINAGTAVLGKTHKAVRVAGRDKPLWADISDIDMFNLNIFENEKKSD